jgi:hypothetical protein
MVWIVINLPFGNYTLAPYLSGVTPLNSGGEINNKPI